MNKLSRVDYEHRFTRLANNMRTLRALLCGDGEADQDVVDRVLAVVHEDLEALDLLEAKAKASKPQSRRPRTDPLVPEKKADDEA